MKKSQSALGLIRSIGVDPAAIPRARPMYRRLVDVFERTIANGRLAPGVRLPPERDLARAFRVSRTTAVAAYRELEARGLVRGYVGRGTFVAARPDAGSAPFAWRGKVAAAALRSTDSTVRDIVRAASDPSLLSFAAGQPALERFPADEFQRALGDILARDPTAVWRHGPTEGQPRFRAAIAARFGGEADQVLVVAGAQQGLDLLARCLLDPGDVAIVDRPGYLGAIDSFRNAGARLVGWDFGRADIDELEELFLRYRPKLLYTNPTYQNPTGVTLPIRTRRELLELAERYRVPIIEDDTYRELTLAAAPPPSLYELDDTHTIVIRLNTFSKTLAPGLRLGWIGAVRPIVEQVALLKQRIDPSTQNLSQLVLAELLDRGVFDRHLAALTGEHRRRRDAMVRALRQHVAGGRVRFAVPDGGLYLWCQLPPHVSARAVQQRALRDSVVFVTGEPFYVDGGGAHELRLCYSAQPAERALTAAECLARSIRDVEQRPLPAGPLVPLA